MKQLYIKLENCFGIKSFEETFNFDKHEKGKSNSVFIYAPNGTMKTSFAKTFKKVSKGEEGDLEDMISKKKGYCTLLDEQKNTVKPDRILVVDGEDVNYDASSKISKFIASAELKKQFDEIHSDLEKRKKELITNLRATSKSNDCEKELRETFPDFDTVFEILKHLEEQINSPSIKYDFKYNVVFHNSGKIKEFVEKNKDDLINYNRQYNKLLSDSNIFGRKGSSFGTVEADKIVKAVQDGSFFEAGHKLILDGNQEILSRDEFESLINSELERITDDKDLRKIFDRIEKKLKGNQILRDFKVLINERQDLLTKVLDYEEFQKEVWISYLACHKEEVNNLISVYRTKKADLEDINKRAQDELSIWEKIIKTYNSRFLVPFRVGLENKKDVILQSDTANLKFEYKSNNSKVEVERDQMLNVLSKGEKRAFYILNMIFEIESLKNAEKPGVIILDDIADSFDYKNKYAIIEYLSDLHEEGFFRLFILTHNFDFFRTITQRIYHQDTLANLYMASKQNEGYSISFEDVSNKDDKDRILDPFKKWKRDLDNPTHFIASIPFFRNIVEFTKVNHYSEPNYLTLTQALHLREKSLHIEVGHIFNVLKELDDSLDSKYQNSEENILNFIFKTCDSICIEENSNVLDLANKVTLSIGARLKGESFMKIRMGISISDGPKLVGKLFRSYKKMYSKRTSEVDSIKLMSQICLMTPENIHLNSFMYEPLLDMDIHHLVDLYKKVSELYKGVQDKVKLN